MNTYERIQQQQLKRSTQDPTYAPIIWAAVLLLLCYSVFKVAYYGHEFDQGVIGNNPYITWSLAVITAVAWEFLRGVILYRVVAGSAGHISLISTLLIGIVMTGYDLYEAFPISQSWGGIDPVLLIFIVISVTGLEVLVFIGRIEKPEQKAQAQKNVRNTERKEPKQEAVTEVANVRDNEKPAESKTLAQEYEVLHHSGERKELLTLKKIKSRIRAGKAQGREDYAEHYRNQLLQLNGYAHAEHN